MKLAVSTVRFHLLGMLLLSSCTGNLQTSIAANSEPAAIDGATQAAEAGNGLEVAGNPALSPELTYQTYELPQSVVHVVNIPATAELRVSVAVANTLAPLPELAAAADAIAAINAGFFDPQNGLTTSYIISGGNVVADPQQNDRLVGNPDLQAYLPAILNRSEFRIYDCADGVRYDITAHNAPTPPDCSLDQAVGAGPQLLPTMTGYEEGFLTNNAAGELARDALGSQFPNARSAIGIKPDGTVVLAIASQLLSAETPTGLTLQEMADFLSSLGVEQALNLDGGSSSGLYFKGDTYYGRLNDEGTPVERPIKSILFVR